jgi:uncharacterized protein (UPF0262 family)
MEASRPRQSRLVAIELDDASIGRGNPDQEHERRIAIFDLIENNVFGLPNHDGGPYRLGIALKGTKLALDIRTVDHQPVVLHLLSLTPFRSILKDYFFLCERYYSAISTATPSQIEAIDMGRRGLHNEAAELLAARLKGKITADFETMRRLFTLVTALHWKG